tara:strand:- start:425 stop:1117 length:693 start_codon:yes stop_codon:yes gene_type:complete
MAQSDDGSCEFTSCSGCIAPLACNYDPNATLSDGACEFPDADGNCGEVVEGCVYSTATNYDAAATHDNGSCTFFGCMSSEFSNYNAYANNDNDNCSNTPMSADFNGDGVVQLEDLLEFLMSYGLSGPDWSVDWVNEACGTTAVPLIELIDVSESGCSYPTASNYDASATEDSGNCVFTGCTDSEALNFNPLANLEDSSCTYQVCPDFNGDGSVQAQDLLDFLIAWGTVYE